MSRPSSSEASNKRARTLADLRTIDGCSRVSLARILQDLAQRGELKSDLGEGSLRTVRKHIQLGVQDAIAIETPYGRMVESMNTGSVEHPTLDFINPFALMYAVADRSPEFFSAIAGVGDHLGPSVNRKLVLYIDEALIARRAFPLMPHAPLRHSMSHPRDIGG